ncbi:hypothetical protein LWC34_39010 [Kibdelosporangium philippinense]|uniref:Uncharacterized protein n=1 Tax=Kibdelosporangium philippinense TaxID=211113 RepID=A0ABS8ZLV9_9PSEU|nr:hypothetical protein [Kibdelosporangium philippinense]MCE7008761.1 hypothetical protein [Kibdelosporangium philippinense]
MSNKAVGVTLAELGELVSQYEDLPTWGRVRWSHDSAVDVEMEREGGSIMDGITELQSLLVWADRFDLDVEVQVETYLHVRMRFTLGRFDVVLNARVFGESSALIEAFGWSVAPVGDDPIMVSRDGFRAALHRYEAAGVRRKWQVRRDQHFAQSKEYGARDEDAATYADRKATEELGPIPPLVGLDATVDEMRLVSDWHVGQQQHAGDRRRDGGEFRG